MLECVINISEGREAATLQALAEASGPSLLDVHTDAHHHRSVFTLGGPDVLAGARSLTRAAVERLDLTHHTGVHPRFGVVDVVPFVPLPAMLGRPASTMAEAHLAHVQYAEWLADELFVPSFLYGEHRSLPEVRRRAFRTLAPDHGPDLPHPTAGAVAVGARPFLVAYNLWLDGSSIGEARRIAKAVRTAGIRTLALDLDGNFQVSCNLIDPLRVGPGVAFDAVAEHADIERAELVGLLPLAALEREPAARWEELDISPAKTIEARLERAGFDEGKV